MWCFVDILEGTSLFLYLLMVQMVQLTHLLHELASSLLHLNITYHYLQSFIWHCSKMNLKMGMNELELLFILTICPCFFAILISSDLFGQFNRQWMPSMIHMIKLLYATSHFPLYALWAFFWIFSLPKSSIIPFINTLLNFILHIVTWHNRSHKRRYFSMKSFFCQTAFCMQAGFLPSWGWVSILSCKYGINHSLKFQFLFRNILKDRTSRKTPNHGKDRIFLFLKR